MSDDLVIKLCDERTALQDEVARLREELELMRQSRDRSEQGKLDERAAHEATKLELREALANEGIARGGLDDALARVAELEREDRRSNMQLEDAAIRIVELKTALSRAPYQAYLLEQRAHAETRAAIDQARGLLERVDEALENEGPWLALQAQLREWLRTHPATATATPAATCTCGAESSGGPCLCTPAATGAEPECGKCKALGPLAPCDGCYYGAEKEQGT